MRIEDAPDASVSVTLSCVRSETARLDLMSTLCEAAAPVDLAAASGAIFFRFSEFVLSYSFAAPQFAGRAEGAAPDEDSTNADAALDAQQFIDL